MPFQPSGRPEPGPVLGIETSCDETAAAVLAGDGTILAEAVLSQVEDHGPFAGVVPEMAARAHLKHLRPLVTEVMARSQVDFSQLSGVAATVGPGLIGGLIIGSQFAKGIALAHRIPFVAINHLEAHALTARLPGLFPDDQPGFPYLLLLVSGGHCQYLAVLGVGQYQWMGGTLDDSAGEAFDKVAKLLGLGWPGGPALERLAEAGDESYFAFPRPMLGRPGCCVSFSGLKTAVAQELTTYDSTAALPRDVASGIAASFQGAVAAVLADRATNAMRSFAARFAGRCFVVSGGVAANTTIRSALRRAAAAQGFHFVAPPTRLCGDNAVMVAWAGIERLRRDLRDDVAFAPRPRWPLDAGTVHEMSGIA